MGRKDRNIEIDKGLVEDVEQADAVDDGGADGWALVCELLEVVQLHAIHG